jgi:hypothetical protein
MRTRLGISLLVSSAICLGAALPASAQFRFEKRDERGNVEGKRASCEVYARIAQVQADANVRYRCGQTGPRWIRDAQPHFRWCRFAPRPRVREEQRDRAQALNECFDRLGDFDDVGDRR